MTLRDLASAAIDISDGLVADLKHLLVASNTGATLELEMLPLSDAMQDTYRNAPMDWRIPLNSGDDYELLFTIPEQRCVELVQAVEKLDCPITRIGTMESATGLRITHAGKPLSTWPTAGYDHFIT